MPWPEGSRERPLQRPGGEKRQLGALGDLKEFQEDWGAGRDRQGCGGGRAGLPLLAGGGCVWCRAEERRQAEPQ